MSHFVSNIIASGGKVIQAYYDDELTDISHTNTIPDDDTIPQTTEMGIATNAVITYTPLRTDTVTYISAVAHLGASGGTHGVAGLHVTGTNMSSTSRTNIPNNSSVLSVPVFFRNDHSTLASQTWTLYFGATLAGTKYLNRNGLGARFGNRFVSYIQVLEVLETAE